MSRGERKETIRRGQPLETSVGIAVLRRRFVQHELSEVTARARMKDSTTGRLPVSRGCAATRAWTPWIGNARPRNILWPDRWAMQYTEAIGNRMIATRKLNSAV